jgi:hypothetical protein
MSSYDGENTPFHRCIANRLLKNPTYYDGGTAEQDVEWLYAFDVHSNAFFSWIFLVYTVQLLFFHWMIGNGWMARILSNLVYLLGCIYYWYMTFLGFTALPFLRDTVVFWVYPSCLLVMGYFVSLSVVNIAQLMYMYYFS